MAALGTFKVPAHITITADGLPDALGTATFDIEFAVTGGQVHPDGDGYTLDLNTASIHQSMAQALRDAADSIDEQHEQNPITTELLFDRPETP